MNANYFFTSDEHYGHHNVTRFNDRPFNDIHEMTEGLIENHNSVVSDSSNNVTIHCGDTFWTNQYSEAQEIIKRLNGKHVFLKGSHDAWMRTANNKRFHEIWERKVNGQYIVCCHYSMRTWARSHYGAWHLFGHSHGKLSSFGKSFDCGVDNHNYFPLTFEEVRDIMDTLDDNFNLIRDNGRLA
jgi:calcineurin-like phosphoesterase family protein